MEIKETLLGRLNFDAIKSEADVRAAVIDPMLAMLGYDQKHILREKGFEMKIGSGKKTATLYPDYLLTVNDRYALVLDAKSPSQKVTDEEHVGQTFSYAVIPQIHSKYFALCNGLEFALYRTTDIEKPELYFRISEIDKHWESLQKLLSPDSFINGKNITYVPPATTQSKEKFDYPNRPLLKEIPIRRQAAKRHFGVHGYFTRQAWNVVAEYIKNFSKEGDVVLDPFGGSGVTAVEALMNKRKAISLDINPLSVFIMDSLLAPVKQNELRDAYSEVLKQYVRLEPQTKSEIKAALKKYPHPKVRPLPKGSDVETTDKLFDDRQTAQLGLLKFLILKVKNKNVRKSLLLIFSGVVTRHNATFHTNSHRGGNAAAMMYYRYRISPKPTLTDIKTLLPLRFRAVQKAKKEMEYFINENTIDNAKIIKGSATEMLFLENESVDYIYTDPPYGKNIPYLDLSAMWHAWLGLDVTKADYKQEAIEGGRTNKTKNEYKQLISQSIQEMYRVLKFDRWLSFVFAHKDPEFWHLIIDTCEKCGFEYVGAVSQKNGSTNFHKQQNPYTVLLGELIINFRKVRNPKTMLMANLGMEISEIILQSIEGIIAQHDGATIEQINDELIMRGMEMGFLHLLQKEYSDVTKHLLKDGFDYDNNTKKYNIKEKTSFRSHIDVKVRIRYYLFSFLRRLERQNETATFEQIFEAIMPLLKNGATPENQTILSVLEDIGERVGGTGQWRLKKDDGIQTSLHFDEA